MKYYIISLQNMHTGEIKTEYKCTNGNIEKIAIKLVEDSNLNKDDIKIHIYELKEVIYNGEY